MWNCIFVMDLTPRRLDGLLMGGIFLTIFRSVSLDRTETGKRQPINPAGATLISSLTNPRTYNATGAN